MIDGDSDDQRINPPPEWVFERGMDTLLIDLYPRLSDVSLDNIEFIAPLSARLRHVLLRWHGLTWAPYLEVSASQLLARRNAGRKCVAEFLGMAVKAATAKTPPHRAEPSKVDLSSDSPSPDPPLATETTGGTARGPLDISTDPVIESMRTILAWGIFEYGDRRITATLERAERNESLPSEVANALDTLRSDNLRQWVLPQAGHFDPWLPLRDFLGKLDDDDRTILDRRLCSLEGADTLEQLGGRRGVTRERIRQIESKLAKKLRSLAEGNENVLGRFSSRLGNELGLAIQVGHIGVTETLADIGLTNLESLDSRAMLWLAGPYQLARDWLVRRPVQEILDKTRDILAELSSTVPLHIQDAEDALYAFGIARSEARDWIVSVGGYRIHDDVLVRWGGSLADKAEVVLRLGGAPLTRDELASRLGPATNWRSMANQLQGDNRFKRTGIRSFGLAEWEHDAYTTVAEEIAQEIERQGGEATLTHLISVVSSTYGVAPSSVRAYALGPRFEGGPDGSIRVRGMNRPSAIRRSPETTRGAFMIDGAWSYRIRVGDHHLRGSGSAIPESIAYAFGLSPQGAIDLSSDWGTIRIAWPSLQPHVGSIRSALSDFGAGLGDLVFLRIHGDEANLTYAPRTRLDHLDGLERLVAEVGANPADGASIETVATAIGLGLSSSSTAVARRLMARGEDDLADLISRDPGDEPLVLDLRSARFVDVRISR